MPTPNETSRIAAAMSCLRPDWPQSSLVAFINNRPDLARRPARDLAVAFAWIAADPATQKPTRILEQGPWWQAAAPGDQPRTDVPPSTANGMCAECARTEAACRAANAVYPPDSRHDYRPARHIAKEPR